MSFMKHGLMAGTALSMRAPETKEDDPAAVLAEVKKAIADLGKGYEEFKAAHDLEIKELKKKGSVDTVLEEKMTKIGKSLDDLTEAKTALEKKLATEAKEREELELRLSRPGGGGAAGATKAAELKSFNDTLASINAERSRPFTPLDQKALEDYQRNFKSWLRQGDKARDLEEKAMSVGSDPDGGYFVTPDVTGQMVKKIFETSEIRGIASAQTIGTDALEGIEDTGEAGAGYAGETAQGPDATTPQVGKWRIPVYWIDTEPKATQQLLDDANVDIEAWLAGKVADKFGRFENSEFCVGTSKIRGLTKYTNTSDTGSGVAWGTVGYMFTGASGDFAATNPGDNLIDLVGLLKNAYLANGRWLTRRSVIQKIRKFKDSTGQYLWQPSLQMGVPEAILGYPVTRAEDMPAIAASSFSLAFGDFRQAYQIVDRVGIRVLRDPYTAKPFVKFYTTKRTGGGVVNFEAFKLLKFFTS